MTGVFITFEGPEGAGKTTLINQLKPALEQIVKTELMLTREPGGNVIAEKIRDIILDKNHTAMDSRTEALLYAAARRQHLVDKVLPALAKGNVVLCDRFVDSSIAYQGYARQIGVDGIIEINRFATNDKQPDLTFYLDLDVEIGLNRIRQNRSDEINRLDMETLEFHRAVRQGYLAISNQDTKRVVVLDATQTTEKLLQECLNILKQRFPKIVN